MMLTGLGIHFLSRGKIFGLSLPGIVMLLSVSCVSAPVDKLSATAIQDSARDNTVNAVESYSAAYSAKETSPVPLHEIEGEKGLSNAFSSIDELCKEVLEKVAQKDKRYLEALALTEDEFKRYYWPHSDWSRPEVRMPFEFFWGDLHQKSSFKLAGILAKFGGKKFEFVSLRFAEETTEYQDARVHSDPRITVRNEDGKESEVKMFGAIFEMNSKYKIFSYK